METIIFSNALITVVVGIAIVGVPGAIVFLLVRKITKYLGRR